MERKGIYNKGRQGHARNVSSYRIAKEQFKKYRIGLTALVALAIVFGTFETVGEHSGQLQTSLLTAEEVRELGTMPRNEAIKRMLAVLKSSMDDCALHKYTPCLTAASKLATEIVSSTREIPYLLEELIAFENEYGPTLAELVCNAKLPDTILSLRRSQETLSGFLEKYGSFYEIEELHDARNQIEALGRTIQKFVSSCGLG